MNNFFSTSDNKTSLNNQYDDLKNNYEQIFVEAAESIRKETSSFKPVNPCEKCSIKDCKIEKKDVFTAYPPNCLYRDWQLKVLTFLAGDYIRINIDRFQYLYYAKNKEKIVSSPQMKLISLGHDLYLGKYDYYMKKSNSTTLFFILSCCKKTNTTLSV